MRLSRNVRCSWVLVAILSLSIGGCGSKSGGSNASDASSDVTGSDGNPTGCPPAKPSPATSCDVDGSAGCYYPTTGGCGGATCTCTGGTWSCFDGAGSCDASASDGASEGGSADGAVSDAETCPAAPPPIGGACSAGLSCTYCDGGALCDCNAGQWECGGSTACLPGGGD